MLEINLSPNDLFFYCLRLICFTIYNLLYRDTMYTILYTLLYTKIKNKLKALIRPYIPVLSILIIIPSPLYYMLYFLY